MIEAASIPVIEGDMDALIVHATQVDGTGAALIDTGARVHAGWQELGAVYHAPEAGQLLAATLPVLQVTASTGEDVRAAAAALIRYAGDVRDVQARLDALRGRAVQFQADMRVVGDPSVDPAYVQENASLVAGVNAAMADFDDAQRRCANTINALSGSGPVYRPVDDNGVVDRGEYGYTRSQLDAATAEPGGVPWDRPVAEAAPPHEDALIDPVAAGHTALDVLGLVPIAGEVADGLNALWYSAEGDYLDAGLSAAAMVPVVGWVSTGGKLGVKGFTVARSAAAAKAWVKDQPAVVPPHAQKLPFMPNVKFPAGEKYTWTDPPTQKKVTYYAHGPDPDRLPTENAGRGPIYRIQIGRHWVGTNGARYTPNSVNPESPAFDPAAVNDSHIPYPKDQPAPHESHQRVFVPNPAGLVPTDDGEGS